MRFAVGQARFGRLGVLAIAGAAIAACAFSIAQSADAAGIRGQALVNDVLTKSCLDADTDTAVKDPRHSDPVDPRPCKGLANQSWFALGDTAGSAGSTLRIEGPPLGPDNRCLDAWPDRRRFGGYAVALWQCEKRATQRWQWLPAGDDGKKGFRLRNVKFQQCLMAYTIRSVPHVGLAPCGTFRNQIWHPASTQKFRER